MADEEIFIQYISENYTRLKRKYCRFCQENQFSWDEDIYSETILRCYDTIKKKGKLNDTTPHGIESYFFLAFRNNIRNEKNYCRTKNRDYNVTSDNIEQLYEDWYNDNHTSSTQKLKRDLFIDFATLYIILSVEEAFDAEHARLYKLKVLVKGMTFKKLADTTHIKASRRKVIEVQRWVKEHITRELVNKAFYDWYEGVMN